MSPTQQISHSKEPIRLFKSDFLEFFTHIHPLVVAAVWGPIAILFLVLAIVNRASGRSALYIPLLFVGGLFFWTFAEYMLHRFLFHMHPRAPWQERISFLMHGVHHAQPMEKTRLVMPPLVSIPMAAVFYGVYYLLFGVILGAPHAVAPFFSGFIAGYLIYDMTHYSLHHVQIRWSYWTFLRKHHMHHHTQLPVQRFGVSSPLWDYVFRTEPVVTEK
jgi:sterol desaturase/sphingolipid hydroxylase (fatty acid hydroxylase superfamily)